MNRMDSRDKSVRTKIGIAITVLIILIILITVFILMNYGKDFRPEFRDIFGMNNKKIQIDHNKIVNFDKDFIVQPALNRDAFRTMPEVHGLYVSGNTFRSDKMFNYILEIADNTDINAFIIDLKDDSGYLTYASELDYLEDAELSSNFLISDMAEKIRILEEHKIYLIARIVCFKDNIIPKKRNELAVKRRDGSLWRDNSNSTWLDPYNKSSWEYPIKIAEEAALLGFKEIQFDYVRFPTDGKLSNIYYEDDYGNSMSEAITEFLKYAKEKLARYGVYTSADVFGLVTTDYSDLNLGQNLESIASAVDIISPMVYPSHYNRGAYNVAYPNSDPYSIIKYCMTESKRRLDALEAEKITCIVRPWLQDFSATWLKKAYGNEYKDYGIPEIKAQIRACNDAGVSQWMFWNSGNIYTADGFIK